MGKNNRIISYDEGDLVVGQDGKVYAASGSGLEALSVSVHEDVRACISDDLIISSQGEVLSKKIESEVKDEIEKQISSDELVKLTEKYLVQRLEEIMSDPDKELICKLISDKRLDEIESKIDDLKDSIEKLRFVLRRVTDCLGDKGRGYRI